MLFSGYDEDQVGSSWTRTEVGIGPHDESYTDYYDEFFGEALVDDTSENQEPYHLPAAYYSCIVDLIARYPYRYIHVAPTNNALDEIDDPCPSLRTTIRCWRHGLEPFSDLDEATLMHWIELGCPSEALKEWYTEALASADLGMADP